MPRNATLCATLTLTLAAALMSACATPTTESAAVASSKPAAAADDEITTMTGSRLKRKSTDRILKSTDNATFRRDNSIQSLGNEVGIKGN